MPRQIVAKVKEERPEVLEKTAEWADDVRWRYEVIPNKDKVKKLHKFVKPPLGESSSKPSKVSDRQLEWYEKETKIQVTSLRLI